MWSLKSCKSLWVMILVLTTYPHTTCVPQSHNTRPAENTTRRASDMPVKAARRYSLVMSWGEVGRLLDGSWRWLRRRFRALPAQSTSTDLTIRLGPPERQRGAFYDPAEAPRGILRVGGDLTTTGRSGMRWRGCGGERRGFYRGLVNGWNGGLRSVGFFIFFEKFYGGLLEKWF